jgi:hypothetical protein
MDKTAVITLLILALAILIREVRDYIKWHLPPREWFIKERKENEFSK